jgi:uncharacterized membrane protein
MSSNGNVCASQDTFNEAFKKAVKNYGQVPEKDKNLYTAVGIIYLVLTIWAIILAMRISDSEHRVIHIIFAVLFGPLYVLSHYLAMIRK